jgi:transcriptional regulator with XRE-family HTH domain
LIAAETRKVVMGWMQQLGEEIAKARRRAGLTQAQLGNKVADARREAGLTDDNDDRVSRQSIGLYERGKTPPPFETLACIARVLKAEQFVVEDLNVTFASNGRAGPHVAPHQLELKFDKDDGVTVRIQSASEGLTIKAISA